LVGMTSLLQHLRTAQYADFIVRINSQEWDGISTRIILRNAQLRAGLAGCILTIEPSKLLQVNIPNNFNFNILKDMKDQLFNFDAINVDDWHLDILDTTILDFLLQPNYNHNNTRGQGQAILRPNQIKMTLGISAAGPLPYFTKYQPITPQHPSLDRRRKEWVIVNTNRLSEVGKIVEKNSVTTFLYQHWIIREGSDLLIKCAGCSTSSMNGQTSTGTCIRRGHFSKATVIKVEVLTKKIEEASFRIITPTNLIKRRTITSTAAFNNEQKLITVDIPLIDHNIISRFITSPLLAHELKNNNIIIKKVFKKHHSITDILTIATLNISGLTGIKQIMITDIMKEKNINIMGIAETWISNKSAKYIYKDEQNYMFYHNNIEKSRSIGVGIIVKNNYSKFVYNSGSFEGRIIFIDLAFKGNNKIHIIQYYGITTELTAKCKKEDKKYTTKLIEIIKEGRANQLEILVMGDFNCDYEDYKQNLYMGKSINYKDMIFDKLENKYNLYDPVKLIYNISPNNRISTFILKNKKHRARRLDYIWVTERLFMQQQDTTIIKLTSEFGINTDHKMLTFSMWTDELVGRISLSKLKKKIDINRIIYQYDKMDNEKWIQYQQDLNEYIEKYNLSKEEISNQNNLETIWNIIKQGFLQTSERNIPVEKIKNNKQRSNPLRQSSAYKFLKFIKNLKSLLKKPSNIVKIKKSWTKYKEKLTKYFYDKINFDWNIRAVDQRCRDYKDNQKKMIDSIIEREFKAIVIDKVLTTNNNGKKILVTDIDKIKEIVNNHFQTVAGS
ncbi:5783_t:CDS:2, partial [Rhizophagus irregularis]